jgi:hypothetical protein
MVFLALYDIVFACQLVNKRLLGQPMLTADTKLEKIISRGLWSIKEEYQS